MELRGQDHKEIGMSSSLNYNTPNRDSSSNVPSAPTASSLLERRRDHHQQTGTPQTIDHQHHQYHQYHHHQFNIQTQMQKPTRNSDHLTPDPPLAPNSTSTTATNTAPTPSRSISSRSPPPAPPTSTTITNTSASSPSVRYRECLKNHAASMGGHVVDGCGEFMPSGEECTPEALKCAACECHRSFHRKEIDGEPQYAVNSYYKNNGQRNTLPPLQQLVTSLPLPQLSLHHQHYRYPHGLSMNTSTAPIAPVMMTFGGGSDGGAAAESSSEDLNMFQTANMQGQPSGQLSLSKKRFRTKFTQDQKEKMMEFAEKLGWKIQKQDEQEMQQFCSQTGVKRKVFKVWMHNNKQALKKKQM